MVATATTLAVADAVDLTNATRERSYDLLCAVDGNSLAGTNRREARSLVAAISICLLRAYVSILSTVRMMGLSYRRLAALERSWARALTREGRALAVAGPAAVAIVLAHGLGAALDVRSISRARTVDSCTARFGTLRG